MHLEYTGKGSVSEKTDHMCEDDNKQVNKGELEMQRRGHWRGACTAKNENVCGRLRGRGENELN